MELVFQHIKSIVVFISIIIFKGIVLLSASTNCLINIHKAEKFTKRAVRLQETSQWQPTNTYTDTHTHTHMLKQGYWTSEISHFSLTATEPTSLLVP